MGGIGVIHAGLSPEEQKRQVRKVKLELNGRIDKPITVSRSDKIGDVVAMCEDKKYKFRSFPVVDKQGKLQGLLTRRDISFAKEGAKVSDVMTKYDPSKVVTGTNSTSPEQAFELMKKVRKKILPLTDGADQVVGLYVLKDVQRLLNGNPKHYNIDNKGHLRVAAAVPTDDGALERIELMEGYIDVAVIDTAQGDSDYAINTLKKIKQQFPKLDVVIGNISNSESARELAKAGADGIKVGQGPGSICTTRIETGIGAPQVTAVYECAKAVEEFDIPVCADGGITNPGDISIAIAAGASCVMMGSGLAGTKETPGEVIMTDGNEMVKIYRGMGSPSAMRESAASRKRYGADKSTGKPLSEGVEARVVYKGPVVDVLDHYIKALRKSMSYVGSPDIDYHRQNTRFVRITNAGYRESQPHDVHVISSR